MGEKSGEKVGEKVEKRVREKGQGERSRKAYGERSGEKVRGKDQEKVFCNLLLFIWLRGQASPSPRHALIQTLPSYCLGEEFPIEMR